MPITISCGGCYQWQVWVEPGNAGMGGKQSLKTILVCRRETGFANLDVVFLQMPHAEERATHQRDKECRQKDIPQRLVWLVKLPPKRQGQEEANPEDDMGNIAFSLRHSAHSSTPKSPQTGPENRSLSNDRKGCKALISGESHAGISRRECASTCAASRPAATGEGNLCSQTSMDCWAKIPAIAPCHDAVVTEGMRGLARSPAA